MDIAFEAAAKIGARDSLAYFLSGALSMPSSLSKAHVCYILENATRYDNIIREYSLALITSLSAKQLEFSRDSFDKGTIHFIGLNALISASKIDFESLGVASEETLVRLFYERCLLILNTERTGELQSILDLPERDEDKAFLISLLSRQLAR